MQEKLVFKFYVSRFRFLTFKSYQNFVNKNTFNNHDYLYEGSINADSKEQALENWLSLNGYKLHSNNYSRIVTKKGITYKVTILHNNAIV